MKLKHLKSKSVINVYNGKFLGYITDVFISLPKGNIESLIIKQPFLKRIFGLVASYSKYIINWENIISIGKDVILVNIIEN